MGMNVILNIFNFGNHIYWPVLNDAPDTKHQLVFITGFLLLQRLSFRAVKLSFSCFDVIIMNRVAKCYQRICVVVCPCHPFILAFRHDFQLESACQSGHRGNYAVAASANISIVASMYHFYKFARHNKYNIFPSRTSGKRCCTLIN